MLNNLGQPHLKLILSHNYDLLSHLRLHLIQLLSDHGPFGKYLCNRELIDNDKCTIYNIEHSETVQHLITDCNFSILSSTIIRNEQDLKHLCSKLDQLFNILNFNHS